MKTLVVLTDFTIKAENTSFYALNLAKYIQADLFLCHAMPVGLNINENTEFVAHPEYLDAMYDLAELAGRLKKHLNKYIEKGQFKPVITYNIKMGTMAKVLSDIGADRDIMIAVISAHQSTKWISLLMGSDTNELIDNTDYPVLVIPYGLHFKPLKTIAFGTDMSKESLGSIHILSDFAGLVGSEIVITYVADKLSNGYHDYSRFQRFSTSVNKDVGYPKIRYQIIHDKQVVRGLRQLPKDINADMIAVVHRKRSFLQQLFGAGISLMKTNFSVRPTLIFPLRTAQKNDMVF